MKRKKVTLTSRIELFAPGCGRKNGVTFILEEGMTGEVFPLRSVWDKMIIATFKITPKFKIKLDVYNGEVKVEE